MLYPYCRSYRKLSASRDYQMIKILNESIKMHLKHLPVSTYWRMKKAQANRHISSRLNFNASIIFTINVVWRCCDHVMTSNFSAFICLHILLLFDVMRLRGTSSLNSSFFAGMFLIFDLRIACVRRLHEHTHVTKHFTRNSHMTMYKEQHGKRSTWIYWIAQVETF